MTVLPHIITIVSQVVTFIYLTSLPLFKLLILNCTIFTGKSGMTPPSMSPNINTSY